jgi:phosphatidylglycerophosphate synthase
LFFVALGVIVHKPYLFAWGLVFLLLIDVVWGIFSLYTFSIEKEKKAESHWAFLNFVFVGLLFLFLIFLRILPENERTTLLWSFLLIWSLIRSVVDYWKNWDFYLPKNNRSDKE